MLYNIVMVFAIHQHLPLFLPLFNESAYKRKNLLSKVRIFSEEYTKMAISL